jgi:hypothetical protein
MEIFSRLSEAGADAFIPDVLQVESYLTDEQGSTGAAEIIGLGSVGSDLDILLDYTVYETLWWGLIGPDISDIFTPTANASAILENDFGDVVGLRWPGVGQQAPGRLVLLSFPLDAVPMGSGTNDRAHLLRNILSFLAPGASGLGNVALDSSAYPLPGAATVEAGDSDVAGQGTLAVSAFSTTETNALAVTLLETSTPGVFVGSFHIISATNAPAAGKLRALNGDTLTVEYFDASASSVVRATAVVDTVPPVISNVAAEPDYEEALVTWDTSEPADTLVQYGESAILNRTAYSASSRTSHALTLPALTPNRTYYYRVVSRDAAGNATVDDNGGALYTFQTLTPLVPPWFDNMDSGATNWSVFSSDETQAQWTLGVPNNGVETSAHSTPDAWGSNLNGDVIDYAETFLISPALDLTGGNVATLRFWHSYDFSETSEFDIIEFGQLLLFTNNVAEPVTLAQYFDFNGGWEEEEIDLSPYTGHVIYLVWNHELLSFDIRVRPGWLVDDVSITVSNVAPGTVQITNNLWQAPYILTGPVYRNGRGIGIVITNAPPGQYTAVFGDVPFYQTPAAQTNTLASGATVVFQGNYTFADANTNGISDAWEQNYFGEVSPGYTGLVDSDGDGVSDYAEFVAGTDPTLPSSRFRISAINRLGDGSVRLTWTSVSGRGYRIYGSSNLISWTAASAWIQAVSGTTICTLPPPAPEAPRFFRIEVRP